MIKLRITDTPKDIEAFRDSLEEDGYMILEASKLYPHRGSSESCRMYLDIDSRTVTISGVSLDEEF